MKRPTIDTTTLFHALSVCIGLISVFVLGRGGFAVSPKQMAELASTKWDYNSEALAALAGQAVDTRVGTVLVVLSVLLDLWSLRQRISDTARASKRNAVLLALGLSIVVWMFADWYASAASQAMVVQTKAVLETQKK